MAKSELRGASRREFIRNSMVMGAMLGWGPARIKDFIAKGAGEAAAETKIAQNLVVLVGYGGAHGYWHNLFPQPDSYTNRMSNQLTQHFMQSTSTGGTPNNIPGLMNATNYNSLTMTPSRGLLGSWGANERYKLVYGVDNMAFGGYRSANATSRALDQQFFGSETVPSNTVTDKSKKFLVASRETPWLDKYGLAKAITAIDGGGINPFHENNAHNAYIDTAKKWSVMAAAAVVQQSTRPTIVPVITVGSFQNDSGNGGAPFYGVPGNNLVPGAPNAANVANAAGMVDLFNSNCAKAMGALNNPKNAALFEAYVKGWIGSSKTADLPTFSRGYRTSKLAANLVGLNLADRLRVTDADKLRYGFTGNTPAKMAELRDSLIVTAKALRLGLTSQVVIGFFNDDPHDLYTPNGGGGANAATASAYLANIMNAFQDDLMETVDPFDPKYRLGDNTVICLIGDVSRTGISINNWNDPTGLGQNRCWVMSNGLLRTGFFGGDRAAIPGQGATSNAHDALGPGEACMWDFKTGDAIPATAVGRIAGKNYDIRAEYGNAAMAAVLYAVTRGDLRAVNNFYTGVDFPAIQVPVIL